MNVLEMAEQTRRRFYKVQGRFDADKASLVSVKEEIDNLDKSIRVRTKAQTTLSHLMDKMVTKDMKEMDRLVTYGLKTVFPDRNIEFRSALKDSGKRVTIELKTLDNGTEIDDDAKGSVTVVESFILRVLCILKLNKPRLLLLDETFSAVDSEYINNVGTLISQLAKKLGIDVLLVTHNPGVTDANVLWATLNGRNELVLSERKNA